ncbi:precorrin-6A synthase (deacetylating) [Nocardioides bruguierae]|uniref:Precorrin-6A synthase (Deacetylating) n=1 Tax=Nocardioides bruguierae TaxID=2945102 RepID=A0A9X2IG97_9ACTN|nr:precorrin-6A synthase (deacetylating) [Nocardioides bruguierae]MCM0621339.1 precorrin-6A synthase (deacetylating) [Nocardioides bruguierae]
MTTPLAPPRRVAAIGIGMGPQHLTLQAVAALRSVDVVLAFAKREGDPLLAVRRAICARHDVSLVVLDDPERDRSPGLDGPGYAAAVDAWHAARAAAWDAALDEHAGDVGVLVWGDPSLYDSTLRLLDRMDRPDRPLAVEVVPGISSLVLLAARHRLVLHDVGDPLHVTTARRLPEALAQGQRNVVVMLSRTVDLGGLGVDDWTIWWAANLGADGERAVAGRVGDVLPDIARARREADAVDGWVMDLYLLRGPA